MYTGFVGACEIVQVPDEISRVRAYVSFLTLVNCLLDLIAMTDTPPSDAETGAFDAPDPKHPPIRSIEDVIVFKLARLVGLNEHMGQNWAEQLFDLSLNERRLLALTQAYGPARAGDLAELMLMDKSQLSRLIKALAEKRLLKSKAAPEDARAVVLSLTAKGQALYSEVIAEVVSRNDRVLAPLSGAEVALFDKMLGRLIAHNLARLAQAE